MIAGVTTSILLSRSLGPSNFGTYALIISMVGLAGIPFVLGLPMIVVREIASRESSRHRQFRTFFELLTLIGSVILFIGASLILPFVISDPIPFIIGFLAIPFISLTKIREGYLQGLGLVVKGQLPSLIGFPFLFCIAIISIVLVDGVNTTTVMLAYALCWLGALLLVYQISPKEDADADRQIFANLKIKEWLSTVGQFSIISAMSLLMAQADLIFLGLLTSREDVGIYKVAATNAALLTFLVSPISSAISPSIAKIWSSQDRVKVKNIATTSARVCFAISVPISLVVILVAPDFLNLAYGASYIPAVDPMRILIMGQIILLSSGFPRVILNMTGNHKTTLNSTIWAVALNCILNVLLIPMYGMIGASLATATSLTVMTIFLTSNLKKKTGVDSSIIGLHRRT